MEWYDVDIKKPPEGEYILACSGADSPVFITRFHKGSWDCGANTSRPCYEGKKKTKTSDPAGYWMPLPKAPYP